MNVISSSLAEKALNVISSSLAEKALNVISSSLAEKALNVISSSLAEKALNVISSSLAEKALNVISSSLAEKALNIISSSLAEKALPQYSELLTALTQYHFENATAFDYKESRLDGFFFQKSTLKIPNELKSILTLVLDISQGQASVERGFNTNKSMSKVNLSEKSMVSRNVIIDHLQKTVYYHQLLSSPTSLLSL